MTYPTAAITTTNCDAGSDSPATARTDILDALTKLNQMISHTSSFAATLLDDTTAAAARTTLGAAASGANTDITSLANVTSIPNVASLPGLTSLPTPLMPLGVGQSLSAPTRAAGTTYTNSSGRPIVVVVVGQSTSAAPYAQIIVSGWSLAVFSVPISGVSFSLQAIVPNGAAYRADFTNASVINWAELS